MNIVVDVILAVFVIAVTAKLFYDHAHGDHLLDDAPDLTCWTDETADWYARQEALRRIHERNAGDVA